MDPIFLHIPIRPLAFARMRRSNTTGKPMIPDAQRAYMKAVGTYARDAMKSREPTSAMVVVSATFAYACPRKKVVGRYREAKPDLDNLVKLLLDSLNGIVWADDAQVVAFGRVEKRYLWKDCVFTVVEAAL